MGRYQFPAYRVANAPRFIVVWTLHWEVLDCQRLEPGSDLNQAMNTALERARHEGWNVECDAAYGFTFLSRSGERRLLLLTARDPASSALQSFSPFRDDESVTPGVGRTSDKT